MTPAFVPPDPQRKTITAQCECGQSVEYTDDVVDREVRCQFCGNQFIFTSPELNATALRSRAHWQRKLVGFGLLIVGMLVIVVGIAIYMLADSLAQKAVSVTDLERKLEDRHTPAYQRGIDGLLKDRERALNAERSKRETTGLAVMVVGLALGIGGLGICLTAKKPEKGSSVAISAPPKEQE